jgi:hypothetical protein
LAVFDTAGSEITWRSRASSRRKARSSSPVELGHQEKPPALGGGEMSGQLGDLALQALQGHLFERHRGCFVCRLSGTTE